MVLPLVRRLTGPHCPSCCRWVVYRSALTLFNDVQSELLRVATYHLEAYAAQLHAAGRGEELGKVDR